MGQTSSSKNHNRNDFIKNANLNTHHYLHNSGGGGSGGGGGHGANFSPSQDYSYHQEEQIEDEEPTIISKSSYSPSDSIPTIRIPQNGRFDTIPMVNKKIPVVFKLNSKTAKEVFLIGTFTSWTDKISMIKSDGDFVTIVDLPEGEHQYKFVVDGIWEHDPLQTTIDDTFNGRNNVVLVKKSDFEVMDALEMDLIPPSGSKSLQNNDDLSKSPTGSYTDEIPVRGLNSMSLEKPPYLPPQLLNIVLNKDTNSKCEPALLPEPNHVMLKHLYALSIRDGVMVLSSTLRVRQKFITTCFYKPI
jgi:5'-AMP-activated protein kinase regulatory beta subunit